MRIRIFFIFFSIIFLVATAEANMVEYELTIARKEVNITGKPALGMTINGGHSRADVAF